MEEEFEFYLSVGMRPVSTWGHIGRAEQVYLIHVLLYSQIENIVSLT
jgi:hypothetical protein